MSRCGLPKAEPLRLNAQQISACGSPKSPAGSSADAKTAFPTNSNSCRVSSLSSTSLSLLVGCVGTHSLKPRIRFWAGRQPATPLSYATQPARETAGPWPQRWKYPALERPLSSEVLAIDRPLQPREFGDVGCESPCARPSHAHSPCSVARDLVNGPESASERALHRIRSTRPRKPGARWLRR